MRFRFSMKSLLAAMVYVALVAAAFSRIEQHWAIDLLTLIHFAAFCYAAAQAAYGKNVRRAYAIGFMAGIIG